MTTAESGAGQPDSTGANIDGGNRRVAAIRKVNQIGRRLTKEHPDQLLDLFRDLEHP